MILQALIQVVLPVFAVVAVGWGLGRWGQIDGKTIATIALYVAIPALLFDSLAQRAPGPAAFGRVALAASVVCLGLGSIAYLIARVFNRPHRGLVLTSSFMNAGNFGLPFALLAWGRDALTHAVTFYVTMAVLQSTIGIWVASGRAGGWKEALRLPLVYAAVAGLAVGWGGMEPPLFVSRAIELLGQIAIPLMLISLGMALRGIRPAAVGAATFAALLRIGGGFVLAYAACEVIGLDGSMRNVALLSGSMPAAVMNAVLAERYDADRAQVATTVLISTLLAVATVPAVIASLG
jgi:predicted permease